MVRMEGAVPPLREAVTHFAPSVAKVNATEDAPVIEYCAGDGRALPI